ncbi:MAG: hypothetical protein NWQ43_00650 [Dolichospermum sp.]|nr:hypothetical protein [Dolichospermum sp.]
MNNPQQPREYDAVLGGNSPLLEGAAVLGGIEGVKLRLQNPDVKVRIAAIKEAFNYGEQGLDLVLIEGLNDESVEVQNAACLVLGGIHRLKLWLKNLNTKVKEVKLRLKSQDTRVRIKALEQAVKYGEQGVYLLVESLNYESLEVQNNAYLLLNNILLIPFPIPERLGNIGDKIHNTKYSFLTAEIKGVLKQFLIESDAHSRLNILIDNTRKQEVKENQCEGWNIDWDFYNKLAEEKERERERQWEEEQRIWDEQERQWEAQEKKWKQWEEEDIYNDDNDIDEQQDRQWEAQIKQWEKEDREEEERERQWEKEEREEEERARQEDREREAQEREWDELVRKWKKEDREEEERERQWKQWMEYDD